MKPDANDPRPAYVQVADDLRAAITGQAYKPGERLPSGRDLARRYGVAAMTISHALGILRDERLVEAHPGRGVFVTDPLAPAPGRHDAAPDPAITSLRGDLDRLADRVARIERILADGTRPGADPS